jgi:hypothetical protein
MNGSESKQEEIPFKCTELNNIKYKKYIQTGKPLRESKYSMNLENVHEYLENEGIINENQAWRRLHKSTKLKKLLEFAENYGRDHGLKEDEQQLLRDFLKKKLNENKLTKVKEVEYDKDLAKIKNIPTLFFSQESKLFSLTNTDKHYFASFAKTDDEG